MVGKKYSFRFFLGLFLVALAASMWTSCANVGVVEGGPRDTIAPKVVTAVPSNESTNFTASGFTLFFDEFLQQGNLSNDVQVSPPLKNKIKAGVRGRVVDVEWTDTLFENTTYLFQFGDGLKDLNEGNIQRKFIYVFSTGDYIDSLTLSGKIRDVLTGDPQGDWIVGLYPWGGAIGDSALLTQKPFYYTYSDKTGAFLFRYLKPGKYRLLAFDDENGNFKYDADLEEAAFLSLPVNPLDEEDMFALASYAPRPSVRRLDQRMVHPQAIRFVFNSPLDSLFYRLIYPQNRLGQTVFSTERDTAFVWFSEPIDSLKMIVTLGEKQDTLKFKPRPNQKFDAKLKSLVGAIWHPNSNFQLRASMPIRNVDESRIHIVADSVKIPVDSTSVSSAVFLDLFFKRPNEGKYELRFLPETVEYIDGTTNKDTLVMNFEVLPKDEYGKLILSIQPPSNDSLIFYLKKEKEIIHRALITDTTEIVIPFAVPGAYKMELLVDRNANGIWDPGNVLMNVQPEVFVVNPQEVQIKANWDIEYTWKDINLPEEGTVLEETQFEERPVEIEEKD
ncbi:MAG: hypothetical protein EA358_07435 [Flavobacteriales bacterium]|nr:MAG: hypothetical protein EA358_07435 [Flavobacteriales bacterium]